MNFGRPTHPPDGSILANRVELIAFESSEALAATAAARWLAGLGSPRPQTVALSGGRIARSFFSAVVRLARPELARLARLHFFWADERCVPPDHADSNYALARSHLLEPLCVPEDQIHRIRGELDPWVAAEDGSAEMRRIATLGEAGQAVLDWVLLGMGEDGHVASLFPGAPDAEVTAVARYAVVVAPKPPPQRITLNFAALAAARRVWVLVSGAGKERALAESMSPTGKTPLARVLRSRRSTLIFSEVGLIGSGSKLL